jgi:hypothetical protein
MQALFRQNAPSLTRPTSLKLRSERFACNQSSSSAHSDSSADISSDQSGEGKEGTQFVPYE